MLIESYIKEMRVSRLVFVGVLSILFSLSVVSVLWANGSLGKIELFVLGIGLFLLFGIGLILLSRLELNGMGRGSAFRNSKRFFITCFGALEFLFLLTLLSNYPGFCSTDSNDIINQALGLSEYQNHFRYDGLSNHHPIFYTFLFWVVWCLTGGSTPPDFAVFIFLLLQSTYIAIGMAWSLGWLNKHCSSRLIVVFLSLLSILSPVLLVHAATMWKDSPFAITALILVLKLYDFSKRDQQEVKDIVEIFILCLFVSLLRNNGIYVSILVLAYIFIVFGDVRKKVALSLISLLLIMGFIQGPIFNTFSVSKGHFAESVSVPLQQIAAVEAEGGKITDEQRNFLNNIRPLEEAKEFYNPSSTNPIKFSPNFNDEFLESHKLEFIEVWTQIALANPGIAFKAWVNLTKGYWQPGYISDIGTANTLYNESPISLIGISFSPHDFFKALSSIVPFIFSMGTSTWLVFIAFGVLALRHKSDGLLKRATCFIPLLALLVSLLLAAPIVSDFRYILTIYLSIPFLLVLGNFFGLDETKRINETGFTLREVSKSSYFMSQEMI